ncbi:tannase/feruloyl esterase family alpha/beta hydrolase [Streptomyces sp. NPDC013978]|uniref:tannase/feruloyl esterase family alpha/beta hydrolase n=1 Tax=Streptomyces sp. NPDC013978 TaxID=3364869 RepID=UPI0036FE768D
MRVLIAVAAALLMAASLPGGAAAAPAGRTCDELAGLPIPARVIGLPTTGGTVTASRSVAAGSDVGLYCQVDADLFPVDPNAPSIKMRVDLPVAWNEQAFMFGGGGTDGAIPDLTGTVPFGPGGTDAPLGRGFAVFASDSGHQAVATPTTLIASNHSFGTNDEALRNFASDALKKTRDAAMYLVATHYGRPPAHSYFAGGSSGGREALAVAQRWPRDFDGVISAYPAYAAATLDLWFGYMAHVLTRPGAFPDLLKQKVIQKAAVRACDGLDGLNDGRVSDVEGCHFDPRVLRCVGGADLPLCLSDAQIAAVKALSSPVTWGYPLGSGERGYPGFPYLSGADISAAVGFLPPAQPVFDLNSFGVGFWDQWVKYFVTKDPRFDSLTLDPLSPGRWQQRISDLTALQDMNDPDLGPFARAGGKLILLHGLADPFVSYRATAQYVEKVRGVVGARETARFLRFYTIPGAGHGNGVGFSASWDSVSAIQRWVTSGQAPADPVVDSGATGRPLCQYPEWPRYRGSGDSGSADSFTCAH